MTQALKRPVRVGNAHASLLSSVELPSYNLSAVNAYNIGSSLYFASLLYALFKIGLTFFQISLTGIESKYMFKYNDNMKLYCG